MEWFIVYIVAVVLVLPGLIIGCYTQIRANSTFGRYAIKANAKDASACELAQSIFESQNIDDVTIAEVGGVNTNCYNLKRKVLKLSGSVVRSTSLTALGVTAFECERAFLCKNSKSARIKEKIQPVTYIFTRILVPLLVVGSLISFVFKAYLAGNIICWVACALQFFSLAFNLFSLINEHKIYKFAEKVLDDINAFDRDEKQNITKVLKKAKLLCLINFANSTIFFLKIFPDILSAATAPKKS